MGRLLPELIGLLIDSANYVFSQVVFSRWDRKQITEKWNQRFLDQILTEREVNFADPSADCALIAAYYLDCINKISYSRLVTESRSLYKFRDTGLDLLPSESWVEIEHKKHKVGVKSSVP